MVQVPHAAPLIDALQKTLLGLRLDSGIQDSAFIDFFNGSCERKVGFQLLATDYDHWLFATGH